MVVLGHPVVALHRPAVQAAHLAALAHPQTLPVVQALQVALQVVHRAALQLVRRVAIAH